MICNQCKLVQLQDSFDVNIMYGENYGYLSSLNQHMVKHLQTKSEKLKKISNLKKDDVVIDIGSNDGTLLSNYNKSYKLIGIDPTIKRLGKFIEEILLRYLNFSVKRLSKNIYLKKAKIISSISMFYDLPKPIEFAKDIYNSLADNGICIWSKVICLQ